MATSADETHNSEIILRDLVYFDRERALSLISQIQGGLVQNIQQTSERRSESASELKADLKLLGSTLSERAEEREARSESRVSHHDLLEILEQSLFALAVAIDVNEHGPPLADGELDHLRDDMKERPYVRAEGWTFLEDFARLLIFAETFPDTTEYIAQASAAQAMALDPRAQQLDAEIQRISVELNAATTDARKQRAQERLIPLFIQRRQLVFELAGTAAPDQIALDASKHLINTYAAERISLRVFPFEGVPDFQVVANLKKDCFLDDLNHFRNLYGAEPNLPLTVFGLVTSLPPSGSPAFSPSQQLMADPEPQPSAGPGAAGAAAVPTPASAVVTEADFAVFDRALRKLFPAAEELERFLRLSAYPTITVAPVAVYRTLRTVPASQEAADRTHASLWSRIRTLFRRTGDQ